MKPNQKGPFSDWRHRGMALFDTWYHGDKDIKHWLSVEYLLLITHWWKFSRDTDNLEKNAGLYIIMYFTKIIDHLRTYLNVTFLQGGQYY